MFYVWCNVRLNFFFLIIKLPLKDKMMEVKNRGYEMYIYVKNTDFYSLILFLHENWCNIKLNTQISTWKYNFKRLILFYNRIICLIIIFFLCSRNHKIFSKGRCCLAVNVKYYLMQSHRMFKASSKTYGF